MESGLSQSSMTFNYGIVQYNRYVACEETLQKSMEPRNQTKLGLVLFSNYSAVFVSND